MCPLASTHWESWRALNNPLPAHPLDSLIPGKILGSLCFCAICRRTVLGAWASLWWLQGCCTAWLIHFGWSGWTHRFRAGRLSGKRSGCCPSLGWVRRWSFVLNCRLNRQRPLAHSMYCRRSRTSLTIGWCWAV